METGQKRPLINELTQGIHLANRLKNNLDKPMSADTCEFLVEKILSSYEKALSMVNFGEISCPTTQLSDPVDSDSTHHCHKNASKKRKTMGKWSEEVKVCWVKGPLSDGYSWRKYGQKDILGANHPRAYYRCTHRNVQGCLATKQVQISDEDLSVFEVTYKGRHTCIEAATQVSEKKPKKDEESIQELKAICLDRVFSFKANKGVNVREEGLFPFPSLSFESTLPLETEKLENLFYLGCDLTAFFSSSSIDHDLQSSDSDLSEMINPTPTSSPNPRLVDWDFALDQVDFNGNFLFDIADSEMFV